MVLGKFLRPNRRKRSAQKAGFVVGESTNKLCFSRWWNFKYVFMFNPKLGVSWSNLTSIFLRGVAQHQLVLYFWFLKTFTCISKSASRGIQSDLWIVFLWKRAANRNGVISQFSSGRVTGNFYGGETSFGQNMLLRLQGRLVRGGSLPLINGVLTPVIGKVGPIQTTPKRKKNSLARTWPKQSMWPIYVSYLLP